MDDPFHTMETDEMSRAFDSRNAELPHEASSLSPFSSGAIDRLASAAIPRQTVETPTPAPRPVTQHAVCPFCGVLNDGSAKSCRQCGMENTQATRQATRGKIGPWFVWQQRNPSAPGMNWSTLMSLVEKGRITPRSVVRG